MTKLDQLPDDEGAVLLAQEDVIIEKQLSQAETVRLRTVVDEEDVRLRENLLVESVHVERVKRDVALETAPVVREEGDVLIVPVVEERLVVTKRLHLVEELHIRRTTIKAPIEIDATRRSMRAVVERGPGPQADGDGRSQGRPEAESLTKAVNPDRDP
ncbi:YsnF/AvaK domain-containing protein [Brevundimonas sp. R86498]|uniref:YsnF/AvaK domain-containing protein n=1 Tax=Brevundimonas sp. R86498 TaxID=3093845 RepID=UPI0037CA518C